MRTTPLLNTMMVVALGIASVHAWATPAPPTLAADGWHGAGTPVANVPSVSQIESWLALDNYHVVLEVGRRGTYRLTLPEGCHNLRWAQQVAISGSQNKAWAGFDYLTADGQQCSIGTIERL